MGPSWVHAVDVSDRGGVTHVGDEHDTVITVPDATIRTRVVVAYGGMAAEQLLYEERSRPFDNDVQNATSALLERIEVGLDEHFAPIAPSAFEHRLAESLRNRLLEVVEQHAGEAQRAAVKIVAANRDGLGRFTQRLLDDRSLTGDLLQQAIAEAGFSQLPDRSDVWRG
jgi:ATP-dependent Zn protease